MSKIEEVKSYLQTKILPGQKSSLELICKTITVDQFTDIVKYLIDTKQVTDIEFSNDYKYIRRMWVFEFAKNGYRNKAINNE